MFKIFSINKYLKCSVWMLALRYNTHTHTHTHIYIYIYIYMSLGFKRLKDFDSIKMYSTTVKERKM